MKSYRDTIRSVFIWMLLLFPLYSIAHAQVIKKPIPDRTVVLTFDDAVSTHAEFVAPLLKKYGFGGTFFVCEFPPDFDDKDKYMTWEQIVNLDAEGFEVGNHTAYHTHVNEIGQAELKEELEYIEEKGASLGIPKPKSFAYPAYETDQGAFNVLNQKGYQFARVGGSRAYDPQQDHPYLIPSFSTTGTDTTRIINALKQAREGKIVVLTIHGVPDYAHDWVTTPPGLFKYYLEYLSEHDYTVLAMEDLTEYIDAARARESINPKFD